MVMPSNLGFPRIGPRRELKRALEGFWAGKLSENELRDQAASIRLTNWKYQAKSGIAAIPSNDFSLYDQVLDTIAMVGAVPERYGWSEGTIDLRTYFAMARGLQEAGADLPAMEMTKWFDTNYHYIVPELHAHQEFHLGSNKPIDEFLEAKSQGIHTRPVLIGPITFLHLSKSSDNNFNPLTLLDNIIPIYAEILRRLQAAGADWVQIDEPCLVLDLNEDVKNAFSSAYASLSSSSKLKVLVATYFGDLRDNLNCALSLPVDGIHIDLVRAPNQLNDVLHSLPENLNLSLGLVDGRNIWKTDLQKVVNVVTPVIDRLGTERVFIGPSCSLLHSPLDLELETKLDPELREWLAFALQKIHEIVVLSRYFNEGSEPVAEAMAASDTAVDSRKHSDLIHNRTVSDRSATVTVSMMRRHTGYNKRRSIQHDRLGLPPLPTTTIGSFPQTNDIRSARSAFKRGRQNQDEYETAMRQAIVEAIQWQESIGLDVLVHGEFERTDMVEFFGEQLTGFAFTTFAWVQSYGSRCVRPPIIFGDISRESPMTVAWTQFAQSLTNKPVKGMLTGPVTILQWSFVRDDQPPSKTCQQIALAIRDEVQDLESAGTRIIQIDEAALREGLPLRRSDWDAYLDWAIGCFRLASSGVSNETQVHTHMCYAEFNDIIHAIADMDADVISIESSRSKMELLDAFAAYNYPAAIGPGVYDIHSPRVPSEREIEILINNALTVFSTSQLWVNPDCGLKTRKWDEVKPALERMVSATQTVRAKITTS
jgi:5-methyltetrahydropteroyltriglutamate--homocysteine methyltransferase